jgi:2-amino-4-hydroxy-6-hydroxymethyldihydropteridine diphosphokinase
MGDSEALLHAALEKLSCPELKLRQISSVYETEPIGMRDQNWFLNMAAQFDTTLEPLQILNRIQAVERDLGRVRTVKNGPRTIDIDILLYGDLEVRTEGLEIPHPRYRDRRFTLAPLCELNPELRDPATRQTVCEMLGALSGQEIVRRNSRRK